MIAYRNAVTTDRVDIDAMIRRVWQATYGYEVPQRDIALYLGDAFGPNGSIVRHFNDPAYDYRIATDDGMMIGVVIIGPPADDREAGDAVQLHHLYVDPRHHAAGVAAVLLDWALDRARSRGNTAMLLTVPEENERAIRFYEKHGFALAGTRSFDARGMREHELIMRASL